MSRVRLSSETRTESLSSNKENYPRNGQSDSRRNSSSKRIKKLSDLASLSSSQRSTFDADAFSDTKSPLSEPVIQIDDQPLTSADEETKSVDAEKDNLDLLVDHVCNQISIWCRMCDKAKVTRDSMAAKFPCLFHRSRAHDCHDPEDEAISKLGKKIKSVFWKFQDQLALDTTSFSVCIVAAFALMEKCLQNDVFIHSETVAKIVTVLLGFAYKGLHEMDQPMINTTLAQLVGVPLLQINLIERLLFQALDYAVVIPVEQLLKKTDLLNQKVSELQQSAGASKASI